MVEEGRILTEEQRYRLEKIADMYPEAKVIGWHKKDSEERYGPVVWFPRQAVTRFVNHDGIATAGGK